MKKNRIKTILCLWWIGLLGGAALGADLPELDGLIEPYMVVKVGSGVAGILEAVTVDRGDFVQKGQVLAELDSGVERATLELARARAEMEETISLKKARLDFVAREEERRDRLYRQGALPYYDRDEARTNKIMAQCELQDAIEKKRLAALEVIQAEEALKRRKIRSPIHGVVKERFLSPGERVEDQPIMELAQMDPLNVEVIAPVKYLGFIRVGMKALVFPEEPVGGKYVGRVTIVDRVIDAASGTFGIRVELPNPGNRIPAGLKCRVRFLRR